MKQFSGVKHKKILNLGLFSVSLIPVLLFIFVLYQRAGLPFDLEWGEGAGINQIYRLLSGEQLYAKPTLEFAALVYTPFYYWLAAIIGLISNQFVLAARLLSILACLGTFGLIAWIVAEDTGEYLIGWLAGALYLACFVLSDGFFDLIRVDSLYVFILMLSFAILRSHARPSGTAVAGFIIALGFYTKQSTLIVFLPLAAYLLVRSWKTAWPIIPGIILGIGLPFCVINASSEGWFSYYILQLPQQHGYSLISAVNFWVGDLLRPLGIAVAFGLLYCFSEFLLTPRNTRQDPESKPPISGENKCRGKAGHGGLVTILFAAGAIAAAWITRASNGGGANNVMSAYAAVALLFGLGMQEAIILVSKGEKSRDLYALLLAGIVAVQFLGLIYNPFNFIPTDAEITASEMLVDQIKKAEDPPWIPYRSQLSLLAERGAHVHAVNLFELTGYFKGDLLPEGKQLVEEIRANLCYQSYGFVMLDQPIPWVSDQLSLAYRSDDRFDFLEGERRSELLDWQGGYQAFYLPQEEYDLNSCLETISIEEEK